MNSSEPKPKLIGGDMVEDYDLKNEVEEINIWRRDEDEVPQARPVSSEPKWDSELVYEENVVENSYQSQEKFIPSEIIRENHYLKDQLQVMKNRLQKYTFLLVDAKKQKLEAQSYCKTYWGDLEKLKEDLNEETKLRQTCEKELSDCKELIANLQQSIRTMGDGESRCAEINMSSFHEVKNMIMALQHERHYVFELTSNLREKDELIKSLDVKVAEHTKQISELSACVQELSATKAHERTAVLTIDASVQTDDFLSENISKPNNFLKHQPDVFSEVSKTETSEPDWASELVLEGKKESGCRQDSQNNFPPSQTDEEIYRLRNQFEVMKKRLHECNVFPVDEGNTKHLPEPSAWVQFSAAEEAQELMTDFTFNASFETNDLFAVKIPKPEEVFPQIKKKNTKDKPSRRSRKIFVMNENKNACEAVEEPPQLQEVTPNEDLYISVDLDQDFEVTRSDEPLIPEENPQQLYKRSLCSLWRRFKKWITPKHIRQNNYEELVQSQE